MAGLVAWLGAHGSEIVELALQLVGLASVIVAMTPTQADDAALARSKLLRLLQLLSLHRRGPVQAPRHLVERTDELARALERGDVAAMRELLAELEDGQPWRNPRRPRG